MKKLVSLILALCLVCLSTAVLAEGADITGNWYGTMYGMSVTLTLNADNTYKLLMGENEIPGTYELKDGIVYMDGDTDAANGFVYDGTTLVNEKQSVTFTRDAEAAQSITLAEVNTEAKLEDFAGEWVCKYVSMNGMVSAIKGFAYKCGSTMVSSGILAILAATGYIANAIGGQPDSAMFAINSLRFAIPALTCVIIIVCLLFNPIEPHEMKEHLKANDEV